jgi:hypothetical protein
MDIQIKYKEVDKKAEVLRLIEGYRTGFGCNSSATLNAIDKLYKEESKEIESVTIVNPFEEKEHIFQANIVKGRHNDSVYLSMPAIWKQDKGCLKQYIDILTKIHDQMD